MANEEREDTRDRKTGEQLERELPPGVKLLRTLEGQRDIAWHERLLSLVRPGKLHTLEGHDSVVNSVAFDKAGRTLASGSYDCTVKLWEVASGKLLHTLKGHKNVVCSVAFDTAGRTLASGSSDHTVKLWEVASGKLLCTLKGHDDTVECVAFDPRGRTLASGGGGRDREVKLWEVARGEMLHTLTRHMDTVSSLAFHPSGRILASGSHACMVRLWDISRPVELFWYNSRL